MIAVNKPAGQLFHGYTKGLPSPLADQLKDYIRQEKNKDGGVYLGIIHRLDRPVSGVAIFARNSKATSRVSKQFQDRSVDKIYLALVAGQLKEPAGSLEDELPRIGPADGNENLVYCQLSYETLESQDGLSLLAIRLGTGRRHQIRLQLSRRGCSILGDREYGSAMQIPQASDPRFSPIALHAAQLKLQHPLSYENLSFTADLPFYWSELPMIDTARKYLASLQQK